MVIDFRTLNGKIGDAYSLSNSTEILDQLGSAKYFSVFDLASGFQEIPMHESDAQKAAFFTRALSIQSIAIRIKERTRYIPKTQILLGLQRNDIFVYLDDIVIYASFVAKH